MSTSRTHVRIGIRDGRIVRLKICVECGEDKLCTEGRGSDYWPRRRHGKVVGWQSYCKPCALIRRARYKVQHSEALNARRRARHAERMATDPDYHRRHNEASSRANAKWLTDPEIKKRTLAAKRVYQLRIKEEDPERWREDRRMQYALRQEQKGTPVRRRKTVIDGTGPRVPIDPFREWLNEYAQVAGHRTGTEINVEALARDLRLTSRRIRGILADENQNVTVDIVSRALTEAGWAVSINDQLIVTINDLYGEDFSIKRAQRAA